MAKITGRDLFALIQELSDMDDRMSNIRASDNFRVTNKYEISGYTVETIIHLCQNAQSLITDTVYEPSRR